MSERDEYRGIKVPEPSRIFGAVADPEPIDYEVVPTQAEVDDQAHVERAMAIKDPWAGETPPLYRSRAKQD